MQNRDKMISEQLKARHICDQKVLDVMSTVPREAFIDNKQCEIAYEDRPLSIGHGQTISQPFIVALMTEAAQLKPNAKVLEIGTGSGYQAAILAQICKEVYTIEVITELAKEASKRLENLDYTNVHVSQGDGYEGWAEEAPFDVIIVTAAPKEIPQTLINQLKIGGKLIIPIGEFFQNLMRVTRNQSNVTEEILTSVRFVPMIHSK